MNTSTTQSAKSTSSAPNAAPKVSAPKVYARSVALPAEHGGWGFLIEPLILSMILMPTLAGLGLCITAIGVFLLHQPVKIAVKDFNRRRVYARTRLAWRFALLYSLMAAAGLVLTLLTHQGQFWIPLLLALPLIVIQLIREIQGKGRSADAEIAGALALAAAAPAILLAGGAVPTVAALAWLLLALRVVPSIVYVRVRLLILHKKPASILTPIVWHAGGVLVSIGLWAAGLVNAAALLGTGMLLARTMHGLKISRANRAAIIGMLEMVFGLLYALISAFALR